MVSFRIRLPADDAFIRSAWSSSLKASHSAGMIHTSRWVAIMHREIDGVLARPDVTTWMAIDPTDPYFVYGFITVRQPGGSDPRVVFYVYVKSAYRSKPMAGGTRSGDRIARALFRVAGIDPRDHFLYACKTPIVARLKDKIPRARFVPAVARYDHYDYPTHQGTDP